MSHVAWSVCLCAVQKGRTDRDAVWGADSCGPKEPFIRSGRDPPRERAIWGLSGPLGVCCGLRSNGIIQNNGTTCSGTATADCSAPDWLVSHYIVPREKSTACDVAFVKNFYHLLLSSLLFYTHFHPATRS